ncbi:hypothetical protein CLOSCI_01582 [[Clostridium] scindens ATCC 35704]|nr:hypothetical protein CLOSCI_01582 [[Clostridium] scindens ATCC 35704]
MDLIEARISSVLKSHSPGGCFRGKGRPPKDVHGPYACSGTYA